jgi:hypothetical protein
MESVYVISAVEQNGGVVGSDFPPGIAITSIVGRSFDVNETSDFVLYLHRCMAGGTKPLSINWPVAPVGYHWQVVKDDAPVVKNWWDDLASAVPFVPFKAKAKPSCALWSMAAKVDIPDDLYTTNPFSVINDERVMDVWKVQGKYFVVYPDPSKFPDAGRFVCLADSTVDPNP